MKPLLYILSLVLLDIIMPRHGGCSCSRHHDEAEYLNEVTTAPQAAPADTCSIPAAEISL